MCLCLRPRGPSSLAIWMGWSFNLVTTFVASPSSYDVYVAYIAYNMKSDQTAPKGAV